MPSEANDRNAGIPRAADGVISPAAGSGNQQDGLIAGICAIVAGVVGFSIPVLGVVSAGAGIWLGLRGFRQGRAAGYTTGLICGIIGASLSALSIAFWVGVFLFESYH